MNVRELIELLEQFPDQEAEVQVIEHDRQGSYYEQGGTASTEPFDPEKHMEYTDFRGNPWTKPDAPWFNKRTLLLGSSE